MVPQYLKTRLRDYIKDLVTVARLNSELKNNVSLSSNSSLAILLPYFIRSNHWPVFKLFIQMIY